MHMREFAVADVVLFVTCTLIYQSQFHGPSSLEYVGGGIQSSLRYQASQPWTLLEFIIILVILFFLHCRLRKWWHG